MGDVVGVDGWGRLYPPIPCGRCGKPIRYLRHSVKDWPWYCSKGCASGEAVKERCAVCKGVMRAKHEVPGNLTTCKSCAYRLKRIWKSMAGWNTDAALKILATLETVIKTGLLSDKYIYVDRTMKRIMIVTQERKADVVAAEQEQRKRGEDPDWNHVTEGWERMEMITAEARTAGLDDKMIVQSGRFKGMSLGAIRSGVEMGTITLIKPPATD